MENGTFTNLVFCVVWLLLALFCLCAVVIGGNCLHLITSFVFAMLALVYYEDDNGVESVKSYFKRRSEEGYE